MNNVKEIFQILCQIQQFNTGIADKGGFAQLLCKVHTSIEISVELYKMELWLNSNPGRHKKNYKRFIGNWLNNCIGAGHFFNKGVKYNDRTESDFKFTKPIE